MPEFPRASGPFERQVVYREIHEISPRQTYLEIGTSSGGSLASFGSLMDPGARLVAVDMAMPTTNGARNRKILHGVLDSLTADGFDPHLVSGDSTLPGTVKAVMGVLKGRAVDVLLIDGGHSGAVTFQDAMNYVPLVRPGGLVILHDVGPTIYMGSCGKRLNIKSECPAQIRNCFAAWADLASWHRRAMLVQDGLGYGLVWLNE